MSGELRSHPLPRRLSGRSSFVGQDAICTRPLFGGAIEASIPKRFTDVANVRPVPDNQEVFADGERDQSLIFEVVQYQAQVADRDAADFFWRDVAQCNGAPGPFATSSASLEGYEAPGLPGEVFKGVAEGQQLVVKSPDKGGPARVQVILAVVRLPSVQSELLVTLNTPLDGGVERMLSGLPGSVSSGLGLRTSSSASGLSGSLGLLSSASSLGPAQAAMEAPAMFKALMASLKINNWGLFGE
eukprot:evm.model.scf_141.10 EVM.evm.TU.scf_141.10   scf_141:136027-136755(-)